MIQFSVTSNLANTIPVTVIPLQKNDQLGQYLEDIAAICHIEAAIPFEANHQETLPFYNDGRWHVLLGLGEKTELKSLVDAFAYLMRSQKKLLGTVFGVNSSRVQLSARAMGECIANGIELGCYDIRLYHTQSEKAAPVEKVWVQHEDTLELGVGLTRGQHAGQTQVRAMDLMNAPANKMRPTDLASWAMLSGETYGYMVEVFSKKVLQEIGMDAVLAVNQGSATEPVCIIAQYNPLNAPKDIPHLALVGKGITYDTGGLSIKTNNMHYMKSDMGGAVAVLGAVELAARWELPIRITAVVPSTENDVDAHSMKPGDVISSFSGKTIEVVDTDAEGRLVLADGLAFVTKGYLPDIVIDLATLTGNSVMALSYFAGALMSNDDKLANDLAQAGQLVGEKVWRMPLWEEYGTEMLSDVADVRNYPERPIGGAITAAKFLEHFINDHPRWAHIDIAGVAFGNTPYGKAKAGNGFGVRLLAAYMEQLIKGK